MASHQCTKFGVRIGRGRNRCCGGLFADDIVLIAPSKKKLQKMLSLVFQWANTNKISFGVNKCATVVVKNIKFKNTPNYVGPTFYIEHYEDLASDVSGHSLNRDYWERIFRFNNRNSDTWDINQPITTEEIKNTILSMKNNKTPGPDGIPIEFYKALFCNKELEEIMVLLLLNVLKLFSIKFRMVLFPKKWNSVSTVSIPKKGGLSDCNNYRGISLINVGLKIISKIITNRISNYALSKNLIRLEQFDKCTKFGVRIGRGRNRCCGGLFADDIVLIAPSKKKLQKMLSLVFQWANTNKISFGVNKCATVVVKNIKFKNTPNYVGPTFYIGMYSIPKVTCYIYFGIPFDEDLSLNKIMIILLKI
ncbi:hypothetical protein PIROE2DRAFT_9267 [Piromyces sp. E2]|nr:hypothetical protein PIROE2DRAFT_9267 [Piromyces sp. E2]|eukprot:OUM64042.1 hypothetical protein PIROE2DRAFT_9267 [Piromyces sp. E2]